MCMYLCISLDGFQYSSIYQRGCKMGPEGQSREGGRKKKKKENEIKREGKVRKGEKERNGHLLQRENELSSIVYF